MIRTRLLDVGTPPQQGLLRAGAEEEPSPAARRSAARMLGLVPQTAALTTAVGLWLRTVRWTSRAAPVVAPAVVVAGLAAGAYLMVHRSAVRVQLHDGSSTVPAMAAPPVATPAGAPSSPVAGEVVQVSPSTSLALPADHRHVVRAAPSASVREVAFGRQVVMLDHARSLESAGDLAGALQALDDYDRHFPRGVLSEEATLIRIQTLLARGDQTAAAALASHFLREHPQSVHADRIRALIEGTSK